MNCSTAPFVASYTAYPGSISAVVELEIVMIRPPSARCCQASCSPWKTPLTLTAKLRSNSASVICANGLVIAAAALFTSTSQRP